MVCTAAAGVLSALLEKRLKSEKRTRRQLQRRLSCVGVSNHGNADDDGHRRGVMARSPDDDGQQPASSASDILTSAYQTAGLSYQGLCFSLSVRVCTLSYIRSKSAFRE